MNAFVFFICAALLIVFKDYFATYLSFGLLLTNNHWNKDIFLSLQWRNFFQKYKAPIYVFFLSAFIGILIKNIVLPASILAFYPFRKNFSQHKVLSAFLIYTIGRVIIESISYPLETQLECLKCLISIWSICFIFFYHWKDLSTSLSNFPQLFLTLTIGCFLAKLTVHLIKIHWPQYQWHILTGQYVNLAVKHMTLIFNMIIFPFLNRKRIEIGIFFLIAINVLLGVRTGYLALLLSYLGFFSIVRWPRISVIFTSALLFLYASFHLFNFSFIYDNCLIRTLGQHIHSITARILIWEKLNALCSQYKWFGMGPAHLFKHFHLKKFIITVPYLNTGTQDISVYITHPHNVFLEMKIDLGMIGTLLFIGVLFSLVGMLFKNIKNHNFIYFLFPISIYIFVAMNFYFSFFKNLPTLLIWALMLFKLKKFMEKKNQSAIF
jgi:O-antigen ligase